MNRIRLIAAIDNNRGIGKDNKLLCSMLEDMLYFRAITTGKTVVMGRKTAESIGKELPRRVNIVVSKTTANINNAITFESLEEALKGRADVFIIGGGEVFKQAMPIATDLYITFIHHQFEADTFFPEIDLNVWNCTAKMHQEKDALNPYSMTFAKYSRYN